MKISKKNTEKSTPSFVGIIIILIVLSLVLFSLTKILSENSKKNIL